MSFEVGGENGLYDEVSEPLELSSIEPGQEVEARVGQEQVPCGGGMMVLQHRSIIVQHRLQISHHKTFSGRHGVLLLQAIYYGLFTECV